MFQFRLVTDLDHSKAMKQEMYNFEQINVEEMRKEAEEVKLCQTYMPEDSPCTFDIKNENEEAMKEYLNAEKWWQVN